MAEYIMDLQSLDTNIHLNQVGAKALHLGQLHGMEGIRVPEGFCVMTGAYYKLLHQHEPYNDLLDQLAVLSVEQTELIRIRSQQVRELILSVELPAGLEEEVLHALNRFGMDQPYAVRSSATAEDLPHASFAGQQDSYLNVIGHASIMQHIRKCWASLFTERAVTYRIRGGFQHRELALSVIVQRMVMAEASGIMFTVDPLTSNRRHLVIDAGWGLGEALVSGITAVDHYRIQDGEVRERQIPVKMTVIHPASQGQGGTVTQTIDPIRQTQQVLSDAEIIRLAEVGRTIEDYFGQPQDIEWCYAEGEFYIVQSRPITTLYPIPETKEPGNRVYLSVGHQQMMTDVMKPLGLSFFLHTTRAPMLASGGRLFVDSTRLLQKSSSRQMLLQGFGQSDPLVADALQTVIERGFVPLLDDDMSAPSTPQIVVTSSPVDYLPEIDTKIIDRLIARTEASLQQLDRELPSRSGIEAMEFIVGDLEELRRILFEPESMVVIKGAMDAYNWINRYVNEWLDEPNAADVLSQSISGNITSEMGLALMELTDAIRPYPEVIAHLEQEQGERAWDRLDEYEGGTVVREAIKAYLKRYGMRCPGEIDLTRTRWSERPSALIPLVLSSLKSTALGAGKQKFEQGKQGAVQYEAELIKRMEKLPDSKRKVAAFKHYVRMLRELSGYREYPKYGMICRYFAYKQAIVREAKQLVQAGVIQQQEDVYELTLEELVEVVRTGQVDMEKMEQRRREDERYRLLTPPRLITSEGEVLSGQYKPVQLPEGALPGTPVSAGVVEGRARVILSVEDANIEEGDILVTTFTDPGWTPLFVTIKGLITEVGGVMTHGAVIAREYGLPAIVGVEGATTRIQDGQRIRLHGGAGYIELL